MKKLAWLCLATALLFSCSLVLAEGAWTCEQCKQTNNTGNFCGNCGAARPQETWECSKCHTGGQTGKFCTNCGSPRDGGGSAAVTPEPTVNPTAEPIARQPVEKPITNVRATYLNNGNVQVNWENTGDACQVSWKIEDGAYFWYNENTDNLLSKSVILTGLIPGETYVIRVSNSVCTERITFTVPSAGTFTGFKNSITVQVDLKKIDGGNKTSEKYFYANEIMNADSTVSYGMYMKFDYPRLAKTRSYERKVIVKTPIGFVTGSVIVTDTWDMPIGDYYNYFDFLDIRYMIEDLIAQYDYVPTGTYQVLLYLDGDMAGSSSFEIK